jgi:hypothetical protein
MLEANRSPQTNVEMKNTWSCISISPLAFVAGASSGTETVLAVMYVQVRSEYCDNTECESRFYPEDAGRMFLQNAVSQTITQYF